MKDLLGVLGGMGPLASQLFYKLLTERTDAERDQDHIPLLLLSDTEMPDRTSEILSGDTERVRERMRADLRFLEESGCRAVAVTCNTAHFFVDMVAPELHIPVLHMVRLAAEEAAARSAGERGGLRGPPGPHPGHGAPAPLKALLGPSGPWPAWWTWETTRRGARQ